MTDFTEKQVAFLVEKGVRDLRPQDVLSFGPDDAYDAFKLLRWGWSGGKAACPWCGHERVYEITTRRGLFRCAKCGKQFSASSRTPFHAQKCGPKVIVGALSFKVHEPTTIMDMSAKLKVNYRTGWRLNSIFRLIRSNLRPTRASQPVYWPYNKPRGDGGDLVMAVNQAIPRNIPEDVRADVAQEIILGVLEGEITMEQVAAEAMKYLRRFRRDYEWDRRNLSWDQPVPGTEGMRWDEIISAPEAD